MRIGFNDINDFYYTTFGEAGTLASARAAFFSGAPSFTASAIFALQGVQVGGTLSVSANAFVGGTLSVSGAMAFTNLTVGGTLSVSAKATMAAVAVSGVLSADGGLALANATVGGTLSVSAKSSLTTLAVSGVLSSEGGVFGASIAAQANMESAASAGSTSLIVTPGRQHFHPGSAKGWVRFDGTATSVTAAAGYNVSSITDNGAGSYTVNWAVPFSSGDYVVNASSAQIRTRIGSISAVNAQVVCTESLGTAVDSSTVCVVAFGDQ